MERIVRDPVVVGPGAVFVDCSFRQPGGECRILGDFSVAPREGREVHKGRQPVRLHGFPGRLVFFGERLVAEFREDSPDPVGGGENGDRVEAEALRVPIGQRLLVEPFQACVVAAGRSDVVGRAAGDALHAEQVADAAVHQIVAVRVDCNLRLRSEDDFGGKLFDRRKCFVLRCGNGDGGRQKGETDETDGNCGFHESGSFASSIGPRSYRKPSPP